MPRAVLLLGLLGLIAIMPPRAQAGPTLACPGGPDPLRFRPEMPVAAVSAAVEPLGIATAVDPSGAAEWAALAYLTPAGEVALRVSSDGACTFGSAIVLSAAGAMITERPAVALAVTAGTPFCAVAWRDGSAIVARAAVDAAFTFAPEVMLDDTALSAPRLAVAPTGTALMAAWVRGTAGAGVPRWTLTASGADLAAWSAPQDLPATGAAVGADIAADMAGTAGEPGFALAVALASGEIHASRLRDQAAAWDPYRRVDDGSGRARLFALGASQQLGASAWQALAWASAESLPVGAVAMVADAALADGGAIASDFDGATAMANPALEPAAAVEARPGVAVAGGSPGATAHVVHEQAGEIFLARRPLSGSRPRLAGGCGPVQLTALSPPRPMGAARAPVAAPLGEDVVVAFVDDRSGSPEVFVKRSDGVPPSAAITSATAAGCGAPPRVDLQWTLPCDVATVIVEVGTAPGGTDFTRTVAIGGGTTVEGLEPGTAYYFRLRLTDTAGNAALTPEVTATTPSCSMARLDATIVGLVDACAAGGPASGDGFADPGETLRVTVRHANSGTEAATAVRARLLSRAPLMSVRTPPQDLGDIAPGAFADATFDVDLSVTAPCGPFELLARADVSGAAWGDLVLPAANPGCTPCRLAGCGVTSDASLTAPRSLCRGASVTLDPGASGATACAGVLLHDWFAGATFLGTGTLVQSPTANTTYRLVSRCSTDFDCRAETTVDVTVFPLPPATITFDPPPPYCDGDTVTLTATTSDPAATFSWADGTSGPVVVTTVSGTHSVTVTDSNGCRRTRSARVDFGQLPVADAGPDIVGCGAQRIGTPGFPLLDYAWDPPGGLSDPWAAQPFATAPTPTVYTLTVVDPLTGCSATDQVLVETSPGPGPYRAFRVAIANGLLEFTWEPLAGAESVRVYEETDVRRAMQANASSVTATRLCEGVAACSAVAQARPLTFYQAVGTCPGGLSEGPN